MSFCVQDEDRPKNYTYDADTAEEDGENEAKEPLPPGMDEGDEEDLKPPGMDEDEEGKMLERNIVE